MAETTQYAALLLDANGNVDRIRTTDGQVYVIASTIATGAAEAANDAASECKTVTENAKTEESRRADAETKRVSAEKKRHDEHDADHKAYAQAAADASGAASRANAAANQALQIANSVAQGSAGGADIADVRAQNAVLASALADASGKFLVLGGAVYCPPAKASVSDSAIKFGSSCSSSGGTITLA